MATKKRFSIVVATNSLANTPYEAYTNHIQFWYNLGRLKAYSHIDFVLVNPARMSIDRMRNVAARTALEVGAKYLLFLDDDVLIQKDALGKLLAADADIAAGKVVIRGYPFDWMVFKNGGKKRPGLYSCKTLPNKGVDPCDAVGFSFCLIKTDLLRKIPTVSQPYFVTGLNNTEDIYFCVRARQTDPKCKIVCVCDVLCAHLLWMEPMDATSREAYSKYYTALNPHIKEQLKQAKAAKSGDRGSQYLNEVRDEINA